MEVDCEIGRMGGSILGFLSQPHYKNLNKSSFLLKKVKIKLICLYLTLFSMEALLKEKGQYC
jgi:hypothetical protein